MLGGEELPSRAAPVSPSAMVASGGPVQIESYLDIMYQHARFTTEQDRPLLRISV